MTRADREFRMGFRISLITHLALLFLIIVKNLIFPDTPQPFIPSLRVDIVGLPDTLKTELQNLPKNIREMDNIKKSLEKVTDDIQKDKSPTRDKVEEAEPDEMVHKPKKLDMATRQKKLQSALARIKALEKIANLTEHENDSKKAGALIKGNILSKGTSLSGDAKETSDANYYDALRSHLQENWALPVWIARQNLSAQVQIFIDTRGKLKFYKFLKLSGNAQFDNAVKRTISESEPYPTPPLGIAALLATEGVLVGFPL